MIRFAAEYSAKLKPGQVALAEMAERFMPMMQADPSIQAYDVPGEDFVIHVVFGRNAECRLWGVSPDAMGFQAVCSHRRRDHKTGEVYFDVADRHEIHVNMDKAVDELGRWWDRNAPEDRAIDLEAWLVTVPHEVLHSLEWLRETGGKTPDQVFEEGDGELSLARTNAAIEARLSVRRNVTAENVIESKAREIVARNLPSEVAEMAALSWDEVAAYDLTTRRPQITPGLAAIMVRRP